MIKLPFTNKKVSFYVVRDNEADKVVGFAMSIKDNAGVYLEEIALEDEYINGLEAISVNKMIYDKVQKRLDQQVDYRWYNDGFETSGVAFYEAVEVLNI